MDVSMKILSMLEKEQEIKATKIRKKVISYLDEECIFIFIKGNYFYTESITYAYVPNYIYYWIHKYMKKLGYIDAYEEAEKNRKYYKDKLLKKH